MSFISTVIDNIIFCLWGTQCPDICGQPTSDFCIESCFEGCQCPENTWLNPLTNECIAQEECPEICIDDVAVENDPCNI